MAFDTFTADNDPHGEHDFGSFDYEEQRIFWKTDYYDRASFGTGFDMGSDDPADPAKTLRVLTIMGGPHQPAHFPESHLSRQIEPCLPHYTKAGCHVTRLSAG